jgi:hypothetical protein
MRGPVALDMGNEALPSAVEGRVILRADAGAGGVQVVEGGREWRESRVTLRLFLPFIGVGVGVLDQGHQGVM